MRYLVVSDIHGEKKGVELIKSAISKYAPDGIISAGDQCPYMSEILFRELIAVRGNCDRFFEYGSIPFPPPIRTLSLFSRNVCITHGDSVWYDDLDLEEGTVFISGHTHVPMLKKENGIYLLNPGSSSRPRSSDGPTAALFEEDALSIFSLIDFTTISTLSFSR